MVDKKKSSWNSCCKHSTLRSSTICVDLSGLSHGDCLRILISSRTEDKSFMNVSIILSHEKLEAVEHGVGHGGSTKEGWIDWKLSSNWRSSDWECANLQPLILQLVLWHILVLLKFGLCCNSIISWAKVHSFPKMHSPLWKCLHPLVLNRDFLSTLG